MYNRDILVPILGADANASALHTALLVAQRFQGHVSAVFARRKNQVVSVPMGPAVHARLPEEVRRKIEEDANRAFSEEAQKARAVFDDAVHQRQVGYQESPTTPGQASASWELFDGAAPEAVAAKAGACDLVVVGRLARDAEPEARETVETALLMTGRPLLLAPPTVPAKVGESVLIGWNRSAQSARAVMGAAPFLAQASRVVVLTIITGAKQGPSPHDLGRNLAWSGVSAEVKEMAPDRRRLDEMLLAETAQEGSDLLVMGAYSHSRLREMILGGVTRHVLAHAELPVLMTH